MGLPTKKQLNKHKRGTKKAFETLETLGAEELKQLPKAKRKTKKTVAKKASNKKAPKERSNKIASNHNQQKEIKVEAIEAEKKSQNLEVITESASEKQNVREDVSIDLSPSQIATEDENKLDQISGNSEIETIEQETVNSSITTEVNDDSRKLKNPANKSDADRPDFEGELDFSEKEDEDTQQDKYLTFTIGQEHFGIEIRYVTEIVVVQKITAVPDTPKHIRGVINLRGKVIPVMGVRERFNLSPKEYDERTCIIVVKYNDVSVGLIVDIVNEVVDIPTDAIDPPPRSHSDIQTNYIAGMGKIDETVKILLNIGNVLEIDSSILQSAE